MYTYVALREHTLRAIRSSESRVRQDTDTAMATTMGHAYANCYG